MTTTGTILDRPPLTRRVKLLYGLGMAASQIKHRGLAAFLMLFYNQVVGMPPHLVSLAITIALIFDALIDPVVGMISDNFSSRWGRRHPFMYASAIPFALSLFLLWNPPVGWEAMQLFYYMLACLLTLRLVDTFFELPSQALGPELATSYDDRTNLFAYRTFFGAVGGLGMVVLAYQVFLKDNPDGSGGVLDRSGYFGYSLAAALLVFAIILASSLGTHGQIPYLQKVTRRKVGIRQSMREALATFNNRPFIALVVLAMCGAITSGLKIALDIYFYIYFWDLSQTDMALLATSATVAAIAAVPLAAKIGRWLGKKGGYCAFYLGSVIVVSGPILGRLIGIMPENGTDLLRAIIFIDVGLSSAFGYSAVLMSTAMMADVVEEAEVKTGRRSEGLLLSASGLFGKLVSGAGVLLTGAILTLAAFPAKAERGKVPAEVLGDMGLYFIVINLALAAIALTALSFYPLSRARHEANLAILRERATRAGESEAGGAS